MPVADNGLLASRVRRKARLRRALLSPVWPAPAEARYGSDREGVDVLRP